MNPDAVFPTIGFGHVTLRLAVALVLGLLMGYERERHGRPAGLRTLALVTMGSALFTILSVSLAGDKYDPARVAANIVTGIGFLGAGTIMRHGSVVHGLTTAASVWTAAAVGMACGLGWYPIAIVAATMVVFILAVLRPAAVRLRPEEPVVSFALTTVEGSTALLQIAERLEKLGARLVRVHLEPADNHGYQQVLLTVAPPSHMTAEALASSLGTIDAVTEVRMLGDG